MSEKKIPYWALDKEEMFVFVDYEGYFSATDCIDLEKDYCAYIRKDLIIPITELEAWLENYLHKTKDSPVGIMLEDFQLLINTYKGETE